MRVGDEVMRVKNATSEKAATYGAVVPPSQLVPGARQSSSSGSYAWREAPPMGREEDDPT